MQVDACNINVHSREESIVIRQKKPNVLLAPYHVQSIKDFVMHLVIHDQGPMMHK